MYTHEYLSLSLSIYIYIYIYLFMYVYIYIYVHIDAYMHDDCQGLWSFVVNLEFRTNICMSCTLFQGWCQWYAHSCDRGSGFSSGHVAKGELKSLDTFPKKG